MKIATYSVHGVDNWCDSKSSSSMTLTSSVVRPSFIESGNLIFNLICCQMDSILVSNITFYCLVENRAYDNQMVNDGSFRNAAGCLSNTL